MHGTALFGSGDNDYGHHYDSDLRTHNSETKGIKHLMPDEFLDDQNQSASP
jgi:hypothetical protein